MYNWWFVLFAGLTLDLGVLSYPLPICFDCDECTAPITLRIYLLFPEVHVTSLRQVVFPKEGRGCRRYFLTLAPLSPCFSRSSIPTACPSLGRGKILGEGLYLPVHSVGFVLSAVLFRIEGCFSSMLGSWWIPRAARFGWSTPAETRMQK